MYCKPILSVNWLILCSFLGWWAAAQAQTLDVTARTQANRDAFTVGACIGEEIEILAASLNANGQPMSASVAINGHAGHRMFLHYSGVPGPRLLLVTAKASDGTLLQERKSITLNDCTAPLSAVVRARISPYHPQTVDFLISNHKDSGWVYGLYHWDFGDGTTRTTERPYVSHFYGDKISGQRPYDEFVVTLTKGTDDELRKKGLTVTDARPPIVRYALTLQNDYYYLKRNRIIVPPVRTSGVFERRGDHLVGTFTIRNLESEPIILRSALAEHLACDPAGTSVRKQKRPLDVIFRGGDDPENLSKHYGSEGLKGAIDIKQRLLQAGQIQADATIVPPGMTRDDARVLRFVEPEIGRRAGGEETNISSWSTIGPQSEEVSMPQEREQPAGLTAGITSFFKRLFRSESRQQIRKTISAEEPESKTLYQAVVPDPATALERSELSTRLSTGASVAPTASGVVVLPAGQKHTGYLKTNVSEIPDKTCNVAYHLKGDTPSGLQVYASLYYEVSLNPHITSAVVDRDQRAFLNSLSDAKLLPNRDRITLEDIYHLEQLGVVRRTERGWEMIK